MQDSWNYWVWEIERTIILKIWTEPKEHVGYHYMYKHTHNGNLRRRKEKEEDRIFEGIMVETFQVWWKIKIHIQETQLTPRGINSKRSTWRCISVNCQKMKKESWKEQKKSDLSCIKLATKWFLIRNHEGQKAVEWRI